MASASALDRIKDALGGSSGSVPALLVKECKKCENYWNKKCELGHDTTIPNMAESCSDYEYYSDD